MGAGPSAVFIVSAPSCERCPWEPGAWQWEPASRRMPSRREAGQTKDALARALEDETIYMYSVKLDGMHARVLRTAASLKATRKHMNPVLRSTPSKKESSAARLAADNCQADLHASAASDARAPHAVDQDVPARTHPYICMQTALYFRAIVDAIYQKFPQGRHSRGVTAAGKARPSVA